MIPICWVSGPCHFHLASMGERFPPSKSEGYHCGLSKRYPGAPKVVPQFEGSKVSIPVVGIQEGTSKRFYEERSAFMKHFKVENPSRKSCPSPTKRQDWLVAHLLKKTHPNYISSFRASYLKGCHGYVMVHSRAWVFSSTARQLPCFSNLPNHLGSRTSCACSSGTSMDEAFRATVWAMFGQL